MQIPELYNVNVKFSALRTKLLWFWSLFRVSFHSLYRTLSITQIWLALHTLFRVWPLLWYAKMFREVCLEVIDLYSISLSQLRKFGWLCTHFFVFDHFCSMQRFSSILFIDLSQDQFVHVYLMMWSEIQLLNLTLLLNNNKIHVYMWIQCTICILQLIVKSSGNVTAYGIKSQTSVTAVWELTN